MTEASDAQRLPPVPDSLLIPFLQWAGEALREFKAQDVPPALRPLLGFDRRGFSSAAARAQLRRALEAEPAFLADVLESVSGREEPEAMLSDWTPARAVERAEQAAERDDLPLLASSLVARRPDGWEVGVGVAMGLLERGLRQRSDDDDRRAFETQVRKAQEAQRRAEEDARKLNRELAEVSEELRAERASRRDREEAVRGETAVAEERVAELERALEAAEQAITAASERAAREAERAARAEESLREARAQAARARALEERLEAERAERAESPPLSKEEVDLLARASEIAHRLVEPEPPEEAVAAAPAPAEPLEPPPPEPAGPSRRRSVELPPGIVGPSIEGLRAALSGGNPVVIVDGYNVSMLAWGEEPPDAQRQRLCALLERLHLRTNRSVTVVFDGADVEAIRPPRRPGVRVIFSAPGEEADDVVVREVRALPRGQSVVAVSSDRRVATAVEEAGAMAVPSDVFLEFIRK